jgi:hypothetical protein|tara:strand:- start:121 stop:498 length:378 start_codon:yes stop_codon:yes gene_type:complete
MNISLEFVTKLYNEIHREHSTVTVDSLIDALDYERKKLWIDPEDMWDKHCFALDDRRTVIACVKSMLSDQGFTPEEPCPELRINRQSWDNIVEGLEQDSEGNVWADDLLEYLAYYLEHAPQEVRL